MDIPIELWKSGGEPGAGPISGTKAIVGRTSCRRGERPGEGATLLVGKTWDSFVAKVGHGEEVPTPHPDRLVFALPRAFPPGEYLGVRMLDQDWQVFVQACEGVE